MRANVTFYRNRTVLLVMLLAALPASAASCAESDAPENQGPTCAKPASLAGADACGACVVSSPCIDARPINACCAWVAAPRAELVRASGLREFASNDPSIDLRCIGTATASDAASASGTATLKGHVKRFATGAGLDRVHIQIFTENGSVLASPVGQAVVASADGSYTYTAVPTGTPLVIETTDTSPNASDWIQTDEYNVEIAAGADGSATYDVTAVAANDVKTFAAEVGGAIPIEPTKGVLLGEVHDCGDVRLSGATVDTDQAHSGPMFYFVDDESQPALDPERSESGIGTSRVGRFAAMNLTAGVPIRVSAVGKKQGQELLLGSYVVQTFQGAVTLIHLRGVANH